MTSSPASIPRTVRARCRAQVPLAVATPYFAPQYPANASSNSGMNGPFEDIQPVFTAWTTLASTCSSKQGSATGILGLPRIGFWSLVALYRGRRIC